MRQQPVNRKFGAEIFFWPWPAFPAGAGVFLAASWLYVWLRVEPLLEYHSYGPYFYQQRAFLETFLGHPGGLASYAGVFLAQLNHWNWLGALAFVLSECVVLLGVLFSLARISGRTPGFIALVPLFALLLLRNRYGWPIATMSIGLILALTASAAHVWLPWRRPWLSMAVSGLISGLLFYLAGLWPALLLAVLCCLFLGIQMRNWRAGIGCLVLALAAPVVAVATENIEITKLVNPWPEGFAWVLAAILYASVPIAGIAMALLPQPGTNPPDNLQPVSLNKTGAGPLLSRWSQTAWRGQVGIALGFLLGWAVIWLTFDQRQQRLAEIDYAASCGDYQAVLAAAKQVKALNHPAAVRWRFALYHTGQLAENLFSVRNMMEDAPTEGIGEDCRAQSQPLFELGLINDAEHMAHEALELEGNRPDLLRLLARINLLKNRPQAAQIFLNVLSLIPFQGEPANDAWPATDPIVPAAERALLVQMRARVMTNDVVHDGLPVGRLLEVLLAANPTNQMAFEYLMATYLTDLDLPKAAKCLRLLDNFNYARMPRSYEEALLLYQQIAGVQAELKGRRIRAETTERFRRFLEAVEQFQGRPEGQAALAANFADTYWYYYYAARSRERVAAGQPLAP